MDSPTFEALKRIMELIEPRSSAFMARSGKRKSFA
jgi:hypothetical protein